jgi:hypothetical protein
VFLSGNEWLKESSHVEITNENNARKFSYISRVLFTVNSLHKASQSVSQSVSHAYCVQILKQLWETVRREMPELWPNDWILHHENIPTHKALSVKQFLAQISITVMKHPYLAPNDFWLFP